MRTSAWFTAFALWSVAAFETGCEGDKVPEIPTVPTDGDDDDDVTGPIRDDEGSLIAVSQRPWVFDDQAETVLYGMFVETRRGFINLAQCMGAAISFCAKELPEAPGEFVDVQAFDPIFRDDLTTREVGATVRLGPWEASYGFDSATDLGFYQGVQADPELPDGPLGMRLGGDWGEYEGTADVEVPTSIDVLSPNPMAINDLFDAQPVPLRWEPGNQGDIYLFVWAETTRRLYLLEDTGQFDLDLSALDLADGADVNMLLGRWTRATVDHDGHEVEIQIQSNQPIRGRWRKVGQRDELTAIYDDCAAAESAASATPGNYFGYLDAFTTDLDPGAAGCTGRAAGGIDAVIPIDLLPQDLLTVNYQLPADNASLYLLTDCTNTGTCLDGSDNQQAGGIETATYYHEGTSATRVYAILDSVGPVTDRFNLDIYIESLGGDILVPTCVDAIAQGPVSTGTYHGSIGGNADLLDPSCAEPAAGGEGMTQVYLPPGGMLTATVEAPGGNPKLYLVYNCSIADSCFLSADSLATENESLVYTNNTGVSEYFFLVLDAELNLGDYYLDIEIQ